MTLTEFLLARIAEDERAANKASGVRITVALDAAKPGYGANAADHRFVRVASPRRVLAECEAKRRIVGRHVQHGGAEEWMDPEWVADMSPEERCGWCGWCTYDNRTVNYPCPDLRTLGTIYADHPDYRDEWRP